MLAKPPASIAHRVTLLYLASGLAIVLTFILGVAAAVHVRPAEDENVVILQRLEEYRADLAEVDYRTNLPGLQAYVDRIAKHHGIIYCGVASTDDVFVAHSRRRLIGKPAPGDASALVNTDGIRRIQTIGDNAQSLVEFRAPIDDVPAKRGTLVVGMIPPYEPHWAGMLADAIRPAVAAPLLVLCGCVIMLRRTIRPGSEIEHRLGLLAASPDPRTIDLTEIDGAGPSSVGWNQLVRLVQSRRSSPSDDAAVPVVIERRRMGKDRTVLQSLSDGVVVTDDHDVITFANNAFLAACGKQDVVGTKMESHLAAWRDSSSEPSGQDVNSGPREFRVQLDEEERVLRVFRNPLITDRSVGGHVWTIRDVTQQKLAEEMRNQFVFAATHELRTPLANIRAYAETLELNSLTDPEQQKSFLNVITTEATRLSRFVDELLNISRMEAGSVMLNRSETDVDRVCCEIAEMIRPQMEQKRIQFCVNVAPKLPKLLWDKDKMSAAVVNLLGNAAKYTPEDGRVTLNVTATSSNLEITVEDSGIGIRAEELPKVFDKFFRSDDARIRDIPGSGLGLAFTQEVARLHRGKVTAHSELNKGTKFVLSVPLR